MVGIHAENDELVRAGIAAEQAAGNGGDPLAHARSRPPIAENEAIARVLEMARVTGVRIHICHVTTPRGVQLIAQARADGVDATGETCPHYLLLDESDLAAQGGDVQDQPAAATRDAVRRRPRADLLRPRRLADRAQTRPRHLRARPRARPASS